MQIRAANTSAVPATMKPQPKFPIDSDSKTIATTRQATLTQRTTFAAVFMVNFSFRQIHYSIEKGKTKDEKRRQVPQPPYSFELVNPLLALRIEEVSLRDFEGDRNRIAELDLVGKRDLGDKIDAGEIAVDVVFMAK